VPMGEKSRSNWAIGACIKTRRGVPCDRKNCQICIGGNEFEPIKKRHKGRSDFKGTHEEVNHDYYTGGNLKK
jgi:hypothetical protein